MKKTFALFIVCGLSLTCLFAGNKNPNLKEIEDGVFTISAIDKDAAVKYKQTYDTFKDVTIVNGEKNKKNNPITVNLADFENKEVYIEFSCDIKVENPEKSEIELIWMINDLDAGLPTLVDKKVSVGKWIHLEGETAIPLGANKSFYLSGAGINITKTNFYIKNFLLRFTGDNLGKNPPAPVDWKTVPSLKEAYAPYFTFGIACELGPELAKKGVQDGIAYHAASVTPGNEFKPDSVFNFAHPQNQNYIDFIAEDGKIYKMPDKMPSFGKIKPFLLTAKKLGVKVRGHVLVWHSQTPKWFFKEDFSSQANAAYVDKATMNARMEWYIKEVLSYIDKVEKENNNGEHIVYSWDVVNEAIADGAGDIKWLREDSDWYKVYGDESFIINAFRYANKYAPSDVTLCYNDYSCYSPAKRKAICKLIDEIKACPDARIDAVGMQSHVKMTTPVTGPNSYEEAVETFLSHGVNVQVTELDIANDNKAYSSIMLKAKYKEYFKLFLKHRAKEGIPGITGVTIWGVSDNRTWLNNQKEYQGHTQYPLLFNEDYSVKQAYYGVLEAVKFADSE